MPIIKLCNFHFNSDYPMKQGKGLLTHDRNKADTLLLFFWNGQITHWINKMPKPIRTLPTLLWSHTLPRASGRNTELSQDQVLQKLNESNSGRNRGLRIWGFWKHELICCYSFITVQTWGRRDEIEMRGGSSSLNRNPDTKPRAPDTATLPVSRLTVGSSHLATWTVRCGWVGL